MIKFKHSVINQEGLIEWDKQTPLLGCEFGRDSNEKKEWAITLFEGLFFRQMENNIVFPCTLYLGLSTRGV